MKYRAYFTDEEDGTYIGDSELYETKPLTKKQAIDMAKDHLAKRDYLSGVGIDFDSYDDYLNNDMEPQITESIHISR